MNERSKYLGRSSTAMVQPKDFSHLLRMAAVFLVGLVFFLMFRSIFIPKSFGQYGHFRGDALQEIMAQPISFAGHEVCETCHSDILDLKKTGRHARVACESCHGPQAKHTEDPTSSTPPKLDTAVLCVRCHEANHSKPMDFPQVHAADHSSGLACNICHQPHSPKIEAKGKK